MEAEGAVNEVVVLKAKLEQLNREREEADAQAKEAVVAHAAKLAEAEAAVAPRAAGRGRRGRDIINIMSQARGRRGREWARASEPRALRGLGEHARGGPSVGGPARPVRSVGSPSEPGVGGPVRRARRSSWGAVPPGPRA